MDLKDVFKKAGKIGNFPMVEIKNPIRNHPNMTGRITVIKETGIAVDLGAGWDKWFHQRTSTDKRSNYMSELTFYDTLKPF